MSSALREVIEIIHLLKEFEQQGFHIHKVIPKITCKTFEDNMSCINIATSHRTRPRTKYLSLRLHHFRSHVVNKTITIEHISTKDQIADILTKHSQGHNLINYVSKSCLGLPMASRGSEII